MRFKVLAIGAFLAAAIAQAQYVITPNPGSPLQLFIPGGLNGMVYQGANGPQATAQGGAGTLCLISVSGGPPGWGSCAGTASSVWSSLSAPAANLSLAMTTFTTTFTLGTGTSTNFGFLFQDTTGNTGTGAILQVNSVGTSTMKPLQVTAQGTANGIQMNTAGLLSAIGTGGINATLLGGDALGTSGATIPLNNGSNNFSGTLTISGPAASFTNAPTFSSISGSTQCLQVTSAGALQGSGVPCLNSGTSGGIPYFNSATTWASSAVLAAGGIVMGGGAATAPATSADFSITAHTLTGASTGFVDFSAISGSNGFKIPVKAAATATVNGALAYDSTNNMLHGSQSAADAFIPQFTVTPTNGHCAVWVVSGSNYKLGDNTCGAGGSGITLSSPNGTLTLGANCATSGACTADVASTVSNPPFNAGGTTTCNWAAPNYTCQPAVMSGTTTLASNNMVQGQTYRLVWTEPVGGGDTVTYPANFQQVCQPWIEASVVTTILLHFDGTNVQQDSCMANATPTFISGPTRSAPPTPPASNLTCWFDSAAAVWKCKDPSGNITQTVVATGTGNKVQCADVVGLDCVVFSHQLALGTTSVAGNSCNAYTDTATGATVATDSLTFSPTTDMTIATGYSTVYIVQWITANTANFKVCNSSATATGTLGALSLNWKVTRP